MLWFEFAENHFQSPVCVWVFHQSITYSSKKDVKRMLSVQDSRLPERTFFVRKRINVADIIFCVNLRYDYEHLGDIAFHAPTLNVNRCIAMILTSYRLMFLYCARNHYSFMLRSLLGAKPIRAIHSLSKRRGSSKEGSRTKR